MIKDKNGNTHMVSAHEISYIGFVEDLSKGTLVKHTCDIRLCVNPAHLEIFIPVDAKVKYMVRK